MGTMRAPQIWANVIFHYNAPKADGGGVTPRNESIVGALDSPQPFISKVERRSLRLFCQKPWSWSEINRSIENASMRILEGLIEICLVAALCETLWDSSNNERSILEYRWKEITKRNQLLWSNSHRQKRFFGHGILRM